MYIVCNIYYNSCSNCMTIDCACRAAADWAAAGSAAIQAAAASAAKVQKAWREMHDKSSSSSTNSKPDAGNDADSHA